MHLKPGQNCAIKADRLWYADREENFLVPRTDLKAAASDAELSLNCYNNQLNK